MDWYQEQFRRYFGDDEWAYWLYVLSIALWSFPAFALLFVMDEQWGGHFRALCNQVFQTRASREGLAMQVGQITVRRTGGYVEVNFDGEAGGFLIRPEEAHELAGALIAVAGITTTEGLTL